MQNFWCFLHEKRISSCIHCLSCASLFFLHRPVRCNCSFPISICSTRIIVSFCACKMERWWFLFRAAFVCVHSVLVSPFFRRCFFLQLVINRLLHKNSFSSYNIVCATWERENENGRKNKTSESDGRHGRHIKIRYVLVKRDSRVHFPTCMLLLLKNPRWLIESLDI